MKCIKLLVFAAILLLCSIEMASCNGNDEPSKQNYDGTPLIILDTDIGSSTDDLFALEMLYYYHNEGKCKFLGVVHLLRSPRSAYRTSAQWYCLAASLD